MIKAEYLRGVLNGLHEQGLDLDALDLMYVSASDNAREARGVTGLVEITLTEDGMSGTFTLEVE